MSMQPDSASSLRPFVRTLQIIKLGLISGVAFLAVFVLFVLKRPEPPENLLLVWLLAGFGALTVVLRLVVPPMVVSAGIKKLASRPEADFAGFGGAASADDQRLAGLFQTQMIVGSAFLEGGAFANLAACMMAGHALSWVVTGFLWIGLVFDFPSQSAVERWIAEKRRALQDERRLAARPGERPGERSGPGPGPGPGERRV